MSLRVPPLLSLAFPLCLAASAASVALAFLGAERAGALMEGPAPCVLVALAAALLAFCGIRAAAQRRWVSCLLHIGFALILFGWLWGQAAPGLRSGSMALVDGDESDQLFGGETLEIPLARVPFALKLERFLIDRYGDGSVREYRSRVTITEPGKEPYVRNVRVNHPVRVRDWDIYQMSFGETRDRDGNPLTYTVLQFIRDPGLPLVYGGFGVLLLGVLAYSLKCLRRKEVTP